MFRNPFQFFNAKILDQISYHCVVNMAYYSCIQMTSINNHVIIIVILMSGSSLSKLVFALALAALLLSTLGECSQYELIASCANCTTFTCPNNCCLFFTGGPLNKTESGCFSIQNCAEIQYLKIIVSNAKCEKGCSTCCMITSYDGQQIVSSCFAKGDQADAFCNFGPTPDPTPDPKSNSTPGSVSTGTVILIVCGGLFGVGIIAAITFYLCRKSKPVEMGYFNIQ